jgi:hypothetical protein
MWAALISLCVSAIILVGAFFFKAVEWLEPNRRLAIAFKCAIVAAGGAAIANQLLPGGLLAAIGLGRRNPARLTGLPCGLDVVSFAQPSWPAASGCKRDRGTKPQTTRRTAPTFQFPSAVTEPSWTMRLPERYLLEHSHPPDRPEPQDITTFVWYSAPSYRRGFKKLPSVTGVTLA